MTVGEAARILNLVLDCEETAYHYRRGDDGIGPNVRAQAKLMQVIAERDERIAQLTVSLQAGIALHADTCGDKDRCPWLRAARALLAEQPRVRKDEMNPTRAELGEEIRQMREQPREEA